MKPEMLAERIFYSTILFDAIYESPPIEYSGDVGDFFEGIHNECNFVTTELYQSICLVIMSNLQDYQKVQEFCLDKSGNTRLIIWCSNDIVYKRDLIKFCANRDITLRFYTGDPLDKNNKCRDDIYDTMINMHNILENQ